MGKNKWSEADGGKCDLFNLEEENKFLFSFHKHDSENRLIQQVANYTKI